MYLIGSADGTGSFIGKRRELLSRARSRAGRFGTRYACAPMSDLPARGEVIGRFLVLDRLGAGGMGVVLAAYDADLDRRVALKLLRPDGHGDPVEARARLLREAQAMARVDHPNVIR